MATIKKKEIRLISSEGLKIKLNELKKELMKSKTKIATGANPKNHGLIKEQKKAIARIITIIKERKNKNMLKKKKNLEEKKKHE